MGFNSGFKGLQNEFEEPFFLYLRLLISTRALPSRYTMGYLQRCLKWVVTEMFTVDPILPLFLRVLVSIWTVL